MRLASRRLSCGGIPDTGERHLDALRWGLLPHFTKDAEHARRPINARAETVATAGMYRGAFARRRCLVPAAAFYEWKVIEGGKQPYAIARADGGTLALGGIWESWRAPGGEVERSFAIVTTRPNAEMALLHNRMPVVVRFGSTGQPGLARWRPTRPRCSGRRPTALCVPGR